MIPAPTGRQEGGRSAAVVIGCSAGGLQALITLLSGLRGDLGAAVIIGCHRGEEDDSVMLGELLGQHCRLPVGEAVERQIAAPGVVYLAPPGYHLLIERDCRFMLSGDPKVRFSRPSIDVLFECAASVWRSSLMAVVLTGANDDGARGLHRIRAAGGYVVVQDPGEAEAPQMPNAALEIAGADEVLPLAAIAPAINRRCP